MVLCMCTVCCSLLHMICKLVEACSMNSDSIDYYVHCGSLQRSYMHCCTVQQHMYVHTHK
ncbi:hypothetical protein KP509_29G064600 [Ceratopteris richardii]|uniref:Secreted protein n=1 Tax=Ceratopteris richardii TaxID=49495 RepID=A0A8T2R7I1_CERRI|nr:hypothetical protein KP509_29G064600 [Ceratopteris richardii]